MGASDAEPVTHPIAIFVQYYCGLVTLKPPTRCTQGLRGGLDYHYDAWSENLPEDTSGSAAVIGRCDQQHRSNIKVIADRLGVIGVLEGRLGLILNQLYAFWKAKHHGLTLHDLGFRQVLDAFEHLRAGAYDHNRGITLLV